MVIKQAGTESDISVGQGETQRHEERRAERKEMRKGKMTTREERRGGKRKEEKKGKGKKREKQ